MWRRRGSSLIEVLVTMGVFAIAVVATFTIVRIASGTYRNVDSRTEVQRQLRLAQSDLVMELERASLGSVGVYTPRGDYRWALWFKTALNDHDATLDVPYMRLGTPRSTVSKAGDPVLQRYVLYYVARMDKGRHDGLYGALCDAAYASMQGPDVRCPHKVMVKKEIYLTEDRTATGPDTIGPQTVPLDTATITRLTRFLTHERTPEAWQAEAETGEALITGSAGRPLVNRVRVLASSLLSFELARLRPDTSSSTSRPMPAALGPIILVDLKVFKAIDAQGRIALAGDLVSARMDGESVSVVANPSDPTQPASAFVVEERYAPFTVQVDSRVIPENP